jgi:hypothetical protein
MPHTNCTTQLRREDVITALQLATARVCVHDQQLHIHSITLYYYTIVYITARNDVLIDCSSNDIDICTNTYSISSFVHW